MHTIPTHPGHAATDLLDQLTELGAIGLSIMRTFGRRVAASDALDDAAAAALLGAASLSFDRVTRGMARITALAKTAGGGAQRQTRTAPPDDDAMAAWRAPEAADASAERQPDADAEPIVLEQVSIRYERQTRAIATSRMLVDRLVGQVIVTELAREAALTALGERDDLVDAISEEEFDTVSTAHLVRRICTQIGLAPDWSRWAGEFWAYELVAPPADQPPAPPMTSASPAPPMTSAWPAPADQPPAWPAPPMTSAWPPPRGP